MLNNTAKWLMLLMSGLLIGAVASIVVNPYLYQNNGRIATIGVNVTDINGNLVSSLNWGPVGNGTTYIWDSPLKITSTSNVNATLTLTTMSHSASIISLTLTWNYTGAVLQPNQSVFVELTQTVTAKGDWSYTTVITATEV